MSFLFKHGQHADGQGQLHTVPGQPVQAPEIDPSFGWSGILVLILALLIIRGKRHVP